MKNSILFLAVLLAGCIMVNPVGQPAPGSWSHPTNTAEQLKVDNDECKQFAQDYINESGNFYAVYERERECMKARGYIWTQKPAK